MKCSLLNYAFLAKFNYICIYFNVHWTFSVNVVHPPPFPIWKDVKKTFKLCVNFALPFLEIGIKIYFGSASVREHVKTKLQCTKKNQAGRFVMKNPYVRLILVPFKKCIFQLTLVYAVYYLFQVTIWIFNAIFRVGFCSYKKSA